MRAKQWLAGCLSAAAILGCLPAAGAADSTVQARQEDLAYLVSTLTENHPDFYANTTEQAVADKTAEIEAGLEAMSDFDFAIELSELAALAGDSHTMVSVGGAIQDYHLLVMAPDWYEGHWVLAGALTEYQDYIGQEIVSVAGHTMDELMQALEPMIAYDNAVRLRRQFGGMVYVTDILQHYGMITGEEERLPVVVRAADGTETTLDMKVYAASEYAALDPGSYVNASRLRAAVPVTEPDSSVYYKLLDLGGGALYMQYNSCREDPEHPMDEFAAEVEGKLKSGAYDKFIIDLRNNGGGSDGVLYPITYLAQQFIANGNAAYVLAGEGTFSSALINTVQLKDVGAVFVGTPTGGSVDHFGAVTAFELPNSGVRGQYSNKFIDLGSYYEAAKPYGVESFQPDIEVEQTFVDYMAGVDTAVQDILDNPPVRTGLAKTAKVSSARAVVDGTPVAAAAYEIEGSNYFKLRDLAVAFTGTDAAFDVEWDDAAQTVTLTAGAYVPVGGELEPLTGGSQTATRATADEYVEGMPLVGKAYEIAGNHYFKLRDLCFMLGVSVAWDDAAQTITIDTGKPYIQ